MGAAAASPTKSLGMEALEGSGNAYHTYAENNLPYTNAQGSSKATVAKGAVLWCQSLTGKNNRKTVRRHLSSWIPDGAFIHTPSIAAGVAGKARGWAALPSLSTCLAWAFSPYSCFRGVRFLTWWLTLPRESILRNLGKSAKFLWSVLQSPRTLLLPISITEEVIKIIEEEGNSTIPLEGGRAWSHCKRACEMGDTV